MLHLGLVIILNCVYNPVGICHLNVTKVVSNVKIHLLYLYFPHIKPMLALCPSPLSTLYLHLIPFKCLLNVLVNIPR